MTWELIVSASHLANFEKSKQNQMPEKNRLTYQIFSVDFRLGN